MKTSICVLATLVSYLAVFCFSSSYIAEAKPDGVDDQPEAMANFVLKSERELKWMLKLVTPLMVLLRTNSTIGRSGHSVRSARSNRGNYYALPYDDDNQDRNTFNRNDYDRDSYGYGGGSYGYGGGGGSYGCCNKKDDLLPLLVLLSLAGFVLYLVVIAKKPVGVRRSSKRFAESGINEDSWTLPNAYDNGKAKLLNSRL